MPGLAAALTALALAFAAAAVAAPSITVQPFITGLASPLEVSHANDGSGRLFVVEQGGRVRIVKNGALLATPFLDISAAAGGPVKAGGEQGLLGLAFHPGYLLNGRFFVFYTRALQGDSVGSELVVARYTRAPNPDLADPASASIVLTIPHPAQANHNGGRLVFGPDGYLYIGVGDGGGGGDPFHAGQNLADLRGKILRIDVDGASGGYTNPRTNPFGSPVWDYGLRNPWKFSFDRTTANLWIADVGQNAWEEIDVESPGAGGRNYGWNVYEGTHCFQPSTGCSLPGHTPPVFEYAHGADGFSVTGGYLYRGATNASVAGHYIYGDYVSGRIWAALNSGGTWSQTLVATVADLSSFGEDEFGELYAIDLGAGDLVRLTPANAPGLAGTAVTRYRLYNPATQEHLYTTDANENATLPACCGWQAEGASSRVLAGAGSAGGVDATPYYRLYHPSSHVHHWTTDPNEYNVLPGFGWMQEGIDGYVFPRVASGTVPLYRLYLPGNGQHLWTTDANERHVQQQGGWLDEGIAGYVLPP
ncbi:MAG TPA: PQQ-dependent sugar dehydrogenase [Usitatibacter sp.]|nr:PQQ-dependent sugar dehydrogenase [Usitatibacter sp.]